LETNKAQIVASVTVRFSGGSSVYPRKAKPQDRRHPRRQPLPQTPQNRKHVRKAEGLAQDFNPLWPMRWPVLVRLRTRGDGYVLAM